MWMVSISSQVQNICPWGQWGQKLLHMLRCFACSWLFKWRNSRQTAHRKRSAIWCRERWRIKPSSHLLFDTEVLLFGMTIMPLGYGHFGALSQSDQANADAANIFSNAEVEISCSDCIHHQLRKNNKVNLKPALFQPLTEIPRIHPRGYKINIKGQELINRIRKLKNMKDKRKTPLFSRSTGRLQSRKV